MQHHPEHALRPLVATVLASLLVIGAAGAQPLLQTGPHKGTPPGHPAVHAPRTANPPVVRVSPQAPLIIDRTGRPRIGVASYYASFFAGRAMADGARMNPRGINAASRTLPLGTVARVTDLNTHRSAIVRIEDHGAGIRVASATRARDPVASEMR
jgi:rare lipoprotein A (peptidoglycan hydrolase)